MKRKNILIVLTISAFVGFGVILTPNPMFAHCDRLDGPVAKAAVNALNSQQFRLIQIWVGEDQETELKQAFERALVVRKQGAEAQELADRYFIETAVRLHRMAEGMPYTGVKPAGLPVPPDLKAAEIALETGDLQPLLQLLQTELKHQTETWFQQALAAKKSKDQSVQAGREWVDSYVRYIVYIHGLFEKIQAGPAHGVDAD